MIFGGSGPSHLKVSVEITLPLIPSHQGRGNLLAPDVLLHGKVILVDTALGIVGSMNTDIRSFFLNYEVAMFMYDENDVRDLDDWVTDIMNQSVQGIKKTNVVIEFFEGVARLLAPLL